MMKKHMKMKLLPLVLSAVLALSSIAYAQDTTSGLTGRVIDSKGAPVAGAKVRIVHTPSGTASNTTTDANGRYQALGLRVGGPYHVEAQGSGIKEIDAENIFLNLGETQTINLTDAVAATATLEGVSVTANAQQLATFNSDNKGLQTSISHAQLEAAVNSDRSFQNVARMDPRISITDRDAGAISANGKNFRYNCITVDQVNAGDPFGLASNGLFSVGTPISQDTIESYQLSTSNFDVSTRGCVGANINAVTKSGTNDFHGSAYYSYRTADDDFMGKIAPIGSTVDQPYTGWQREWTAGFTLSGPIIKDTLFFFLGVEKSTRVGIGPSSAPSDGTGSTTLVNGINTSFYNSVLTEATKQGLDVGDRSFANLTDKRYLAKIDWNISDTQRAVFRYSETKENQPVPTGSTTQVSPNSNWYYNNRDTKSYLAQLFSDWSDTFSTEADLQYSHISALRGPLAGGYQPTVQVSNSTSSFSPNVSVGTEFSSQVNGLDIKSYYGYFAGTWHLGEHTVKAGFNANQDKIYNAFIQGYDGQYTFYAPASNSIANFQNGAWEEYTIKQPSPGLSLNQASAVFKKQQYGGFLQDTWQATDRLSLTYGVRYDVPKFPSDPLLNPCFESAPGVKFSAPGPNGTTLCTAQKGGFGYANNSTPSGNGSIQPRVSFNYDFDTEYKTQLRGGVGVFVSDVPTVWYSNAFGGTGVTTVTYDIIDAASNPTGTLLCSTNGKNFTKAAGATCPAGQVSYVKQAPNYNASSPNIPGSSLIPGAAGAPTMGVDTIDSNFQMPRTTQIALGFDRELPWMGIIGSLEGNYTKTNDDIFYKNLNLGAVQFSAPDGNVFYCNPASPKTCSSASRFGANPSFGTVTQLTNTHQGQSGTLTLSFTKPMADDWSAMVALRGGHATDTNPGTSSVANSNLTGSVFSNPNVDVSAVSSYNVPERVLGSVTWQHRFFGDYLTQISAFADLHSGAPYSWTSGTDTNGDGYSHDLVYIPKSISDAEFASAVTPLQKQQFLSYIQNNPYLRDHMGEFTQRNGTSAPWLNQIDMSFRQQIPGIFAGNKGELRFDFFNIGNLLNSKWGVEKRAGFPIVRNLANVTGYDPATGKYVYDISGAAYKDKNGNYTPQALVINEGQTPGAPVPSQRWSVMMTAKYTF
jgi:Carboxypeptidase regulatory-like domain